jgi:hypothetical protein
VVLWAADLHLVAGAPWRTGVDLQSPSTLRFCGAAGLVFPIAGSRETADLAGEVPEEGADVIQRGDGGFFWRRFLGIGARRLPAGSGELLFQGDEGSLSGGAPPTALVVASVAELQMGWTVIFFSSGDLSVICLD